MTVVRLSHPMDAADAAYLGLPAREYVLNEDVDVASGVAASLLALGLARLPDSGGSPTVLHPILLLAGLTGPTITTEQILSVLGGLGGGGVPGSRVVGSGAGLQGGGNLTQDRSLSVVFGSSAGTVCEGNDPRLSGGGGGVPTSRLIGTGVGLQGGGDLSDDRSLSVVFGSTAGTVVQGNDPRLTTVGDIVHVTGLAGDGVTDDGPVIQQVLDSIGLAGSTHSTEVVVEKPPTSTSGVIYINSTVQIQSDYTTLRFASPLSYGPNGRIRIQGEAMELPASGKPVLTADSAEGTNTLTVNSASIFAAGHYIVIRGARDATGNVYKDQKEYHTVVSVSGNTLTLAEPLEDTYLAYNANPGAPAGTSHTTQVTRVVSSLLTASPVRGDRNVTVADTSLFTAGDYVQILDDVHTVKTDGTQETSNYKHREVAQVKAIVSGTVLRLSHSLHHGYSSTTNGRVARLNPVKHAQIRDAFVTWSAMSVVGNAFEINKGIHCKIVNCRIAGDGARTKSWKSQAFRQTDSMWCTVEFCHATDPASTVSAGGYGATLYGSTYCEVRNCYFSSLRHSVLLFNGAAGNLVIGCISEDVAISDYDLHGAECVDNLITACTAIGGDSAADDGSINKTACKAGNTTHTDGDHHNVFSNILVINYRGAAFEVVPSSSNNTFRDSRVNGALSGVKIVSNSSNTGLVATDNFVENVTFADVPTLMNVNGSTTSMVRGLTIDHCHFIRANASVTFSNAQRVRIRRCVWTDPALTGTIYAINASNVTGFVAKANDVSGTTRAFKMTTCPAFRITGNTGHDLTTTIVLEDAGGNTGYLFRSNEWGTFTPTTTTSGTGPSLGTLDLGNGGGGSYDPGLVTAAAVTSSRTLTAADRGVPLDARSAAAIALTLPPGLPEMITEVNRRGAGPVSFLGAAGAVLRYPGDLAPRIRRQYGTVGLRRLPAVTVTDPFVGALLDVNADTIAGTTGTPVAAVANGGSVGGTITQATSGSQPTLATGAVNGHNAIVFDGAADYLTLGGALLDLARNRGALTFYLVAEADGLVGVRNLLSMAVGGAGGVARLFVQTSGNLYRLGGRRLDTDGNQTQTSSATLATGSWYLHTVRFIWSAATAAQYANGTQVTSTSTYQTAGLTPDTASVNGAIGARFDGTTEFWQGKIARILAYGADHTTNDRANMHTILQNAYGVVPSDAVASLDEWELTGDLDLAP